MYIYIWPLASGALRIEPIGVSFLIGIGIGGGGRPLAPWSSPKGCPFRVGSKWTGKEMGTNRFKKLTPSVWFNTVHFGSKNVFINFSPCVQVNIAHFSSKNVIIKFNFTHVCHMCWHPHIFGAPTRNDCELLSSHNFEILL